MVRIANVSLFTGTAVRAFWPLSRRELAPPADPPDRAFCPRRRHRHQRAHPLRSDREGARADDRRRQSPRRRQQHRLRHRRKVRTRRLYAAPRHDQPHHQSCRLQEAAVRRPARSRSDHAGVGPAQHTRRASVAARENVQGLHRVRTLPVGQDHLRQRRPRHRLAPRHDVTAAEHQRGRRARPVQGHRAGADALLSNEITVYMSTFASALPHVKSERLRAYAVTTTYRAGPLPDVPTLQESGIAGFEYAARDRGLCAGRHAAAHHRQGPQGGGRRAGIARCETPLPRAGLERHPHDSRAIHEYFAAEKKKWAGVVRDANIQPL